MAGLPGGRGDGVPITTLIDLEPGSQVAHYWAGAAEGIGRVAVITIVTAILTVVNVLGIRQGARPMVLT